MSHNHIVLDDDPLFRIDPETRIITNESGSKITIMQWDHNSEEFTFSMPLEAETHPMSSCNSIRVHYINIGANERVAGVYDVEDFTTEGDQLVFKWLLSRNTTSLNGTLNFAVQFRCVDDGGEVVYEWGTMPYKDVTVGQGINNSDAIAEEYADIMQQWENELFGMSAKGVENINEALYIAIDDIESARMQSLSNIYMARDTCLDRLYATPISTIPTTLETNKEYNFGEVTGLRLTFPTSAKNGDVVYLTFKSGTTATSLLIDTTNTSDIEIIPEANCYYDIFAKFNGTIWLVNYSEYLVSEV